MTKTVDLECTLAFLFALWAFATGHWGVAIVAFIFLCIRATYD